MTEVDVSETTVPASTQLNADDLRGGKTITIKITNVSKTNDVKQPIAINYEGDNERPWKPGKSMRRVLEQVWGKEGKNYIGRSLTLFCKEDVAYGGEVKGGIRISHMSHMESDRVITLTENRTTRKPFKVKTLKVEAKAANPAKEETVAANSLEAAGIVAAAKGVTSYKKWLETLSEDDKASIRQHHSEWSKLAKESGE